MPEVTASVDGCRCSIESIVHQNKKLSSSSFLATWSYIQPPWYKAPSTMFSNFLSINKDPAVEWATHKLKSHRSLLLKSPSVHRHTAPSKHSRNDGINTWRHGSTKRCKARRARVEVLQGCTRKVSMSTWCNYTILTVSLVSNSHFSGASEDIQGSNHPKKLGPKLRPLGGFS